MLHVYKGKFKRATKFLRRLLAVVIAGAFVLSGGLLGPIAVRAQGSIITWKGTAGDEKWETVSNWDLGRVPANGDTVKIPEFSVVECANADVTVSLNCEGTLTVSGGTLNLTGTSYLKKGKLDGAGSIAVTGAGSELIWQGGDILGTGSFTVGTGAKLQVKSFTTKHLKRPLSCDGDINLNEGYLNLSGGGSVDGSIILSQNTTLKFAGESYTINGSLSDTGSGGMTVGAGNVTFNGAYDIKHTTVEAGATASWNGDTSISVSSLIVKGNAIFNKDISVSGLNLQLGTISGSGNITLVSGGSNQIWAGGSIEGSGELIIESTAKNLDVSGNCSLSRHLTNNGFMMIGSGLLELLGGASGTGGFKVQAGGTLIIRGTGSYSFGGEYPVTNYGQLIISDTCTEVKLNTALEQQSATGILTFDIGENGRFCKLEIINNQARISGSQLKINLLDGFIPSPGQTFEVMTYTSCSGNFASITTDAEGITFEPTYNQTNLTLKAVSTIEQAATPTATPSAGTYTEAQYVALTTTTAGATIHYTTDGSDPTTGSTAYSGSIEVTESMTIKAIAVKEGLTDSPVATFAYVIEPADTDPPLVEAYTPENGAVDVALDTNALVLEFNEPVWGINNKALSIHEKQGDWKAADIYAQSADNDYMTGNGTTTISFNISSVSLKLGKEYYIKIASGAFKDAAGNDYTGISDNTTWTFTVENDTQAPTVPTNLRCVSKTASTVELAWDASTDDHGPIMYNIYVKNGAEYDFVGESTTNSFTVSKLDYSTPLTPDTTYTFVVCALDGKNNASGYSNELTVTVKDPPQAADEPFWRYRSPLPTWRDLTEVKYLNGKFMGLGGAGTLIVSTDGVNWETVCVDTTVTLRGITYGNDLYAAVGFCNGKDGRVYTSPDGINWSQAVETTGHQLYDITYGNNKFVAVGQGQKVVVSSDGITWLVKAAPQNSYLSSIIYTGNLYVAVGSGSSSYSKIVVSTDGENWEARGSAECDLKDVVYGNGILVAVGTDLTSKAKPRIYTSVDNGATWTLYYPAQGYEYTKLFTVEYDGSKFVAAGYSYIGVLYNQYVLTSTDGKVWTSGSAQADIRFKALTFGNSTLVGVGDYGDIVSSSDGVTWTKRTLGLNRGALDDVASNGSIFVAVGSNGAIQTSADGITWTAMVSGTTERLGSVEYLNGKFIAVGSGGVILTSGDGIIWSKQVVTDTINFSDVTYGNGLYMVVGQQSHTLVILKSSDGATWSRVGDSHRTLASTITYGDGTFIALGYDQVYRSDNGSEWTGTYLSGISPSDITYAEGRFIATGGNGGIYISVDKGVTWTVKEKVAGATGQINSVAYGGGNLVAVANDGKILISFDNGNTWEQQVSGYFLNGVVAGSSNFVAVGSTGLTLQSKDFGVPSDPDADAVAADMTELTWNRIKGGNSTPINVIVNLIKPLPTTGTYGTIITWSVNPTGWINTTTGEVTRPTSAQGDKKVTLTATISKGSASDIKSFPLIIKVAEQTADEAIALDLAALTWDVIKGSNSSQTNVTSNLILPASGANGTTISWSVSPDDGSINPTTGKVTRPARGQSDAQVTLTATISKEGGISKTKSFHLTILALPSGDSGSGSGGGVTTYTITATAGTGGEISPKGNIPVKKGSEKIFTITADEGYIIQDVKIDGKSIGVVETYTFKEVSKNHIIEVTFEKPDQEVEEPDTEDEEWDNPFTDVSEKDWFYETVKNVYQKELMKGTTSSKFSPELYTTRATIVTILYRLEGEPEIIGDTIFSDIPSETWYTEAVIWATNNDITKGYGSGEFGVGDSTTREQLAALLYRYSEYKGFDISAASDLSAFTDADEVSEWAETAVKWAVGSGIITGKPGNVLDPKGTATRAEIAAMLTRFIQKYNLL